MNLPIDEAKPALCVIDRNLSFERFIELHFGTGEAEALRLRRDLEAASVPLHDVVVADQAFVMKAADMVKALGSGPPRRLWSGRKRRRTWLEVTRSWAPARRNSLVRRSWKVPQRRSIRPLA